MKNEIDNARNDAQNEERDQLQITNAELALQKSEIEKRISEKQTTAEIEQNNLALIKREQDINTKRLDDIAFDQRKRDDKLDADRKRDDDVRLNETQRERQSSSGRDSLQDHAVKLEDIKKDQKAAYSKDPQSFSNASGSAGPSSFKDAAYKSLDANSTAADRSAKYERYQLNQLDFEKRIGMCHSPIDKERLTNEKELQKHHHLSESKSWLLSQGSSALGNDQATKDRLNKEILEHRQAARELQVKNEPQNYAYQRNEEKVQQLRDDAARDGVRSPFAALTEKARENQRQLEQVREKSQIPARDQQQLQKLDNAKEKETERSQEYKLDVSKKQEQEQKREQKQEQEQEIRPRIVEVTEANEKVRTPVELVQPAPVAQQPASPQLNLDEEERVR